MTEEHETPEQRQTEVIVAHRIGYWWPDAEGVTEDEIAEADAYLEAHIQWRIASVLAEQGEPEWEYGLYNEDPHPKQERPHRAYNGAHLVSDNFEHVRTQHRRGHPSIKFVRRRKAGPWLPVEENTEALTDGSER